MSVFKVGDLVIYNNSVATFTSNVDRRNITSIIKPYQNSVYSDDWVHVHIYGKPDIVHVDSLARDPLMDLLPKLLEI